MRKGFTLGVVIAGLVFGLFVVNNDFVDNELVQSVTNFCLSVPGYVFAIWLKLPDVASIPLVFMYFGVVGVLLAFASKERKGRILFIVGFVSVLLALHWYFNMKLSEEMASIGKALEGLAQGAAGQIVK